MKVMIIGEFGYEQALWGLGKSYGVTRGMTFFDFNKNVDLKNRLAKTAYGLYHKEGGHNKFLEHIYMWLDVTAPRYWWSEADTYRISSKQSESTMHTLMKIPITKDMFEIPISDELLEHLERLRQGRFFEALKNDLPEGYLQSREWVLSYKTMRNIIKQRREHKLQQWKYFCDYIMTYSANKEYFKDLNY